tara:strand:+ start:90 stop:284 length:195 start_codon:yes stop_codon:yes gene_type:complete
MAPTVTEDDNKRFQEWKEIQDWHNQALRDQQTVTDQIKRDFHTNERIKNRTLRDDDDDFEYGTF